MCGHLENVAFKIRLYIVEQVTKVFGHYLYHFSDINMENLKGVLRQENQGSV